MSLPLELIDPKKYDLFDRAQIELTLEHGAYDLVLIENATELFREVMHDKHGNLEALLKVVVDGANSKCIYLDSETFPYYLKPATIDAFPLVAGNQQSSKEKYDSAIRTYKRNHLSAAVKKNECIVGLFAADLRGAGGHYAAYIWNRSNKKLVIFDSMSTSYGPSGYYPYFQQLGRDLFGVPKELAVPCVKGLLSLQQTGGFAGNIPHSTRQALTNAFNRAVERGDHLEMKRLEKKILTISLQSTESQNHFCYIWSIWFINALLSGHSLEKLTQTIRDNGVDPLFVIKRYSWSMLQLAGLEDQLYEPQLYNEYFPRVWFNIDGPASNNFRMYELEMPNCTTSKQCLEASIEPAVLKELSPTIPPTQVIEFINTQLDH